MAETGHDARQPQVGHLGPGHVFGAVEHRQREELLHRHDAIGGHDSGAKIAPVDDDTVRPKRVLVAADDDDSTDDIEPEEPAFDPFAPLEIRDEGLINTSFDLDEVLEFGSLEGACDAWEADPNDRRKMLLCGKRMFFYEGFGTLGIPEPCLLYTSPSPRD